MLAFSLEPRIMKLAGRLTRLHIRRQISDPKLRKTVTPNYVMGCKRILISNDYYPALDRDNVDVVTDGVERVTETGIVTADGRELEVDAIIHGTGFKVHDMLSGFRITGRNGADLEQVWAERGMQAHRGTALAGFPNLFFLLGPNTGLGHNSIIHMIESQAHYVSELLRSMDAERAWSAEPRAEAQERFNHELQAGLDGAVWSPGRLPQLVPRRRGPQHRPLARLHLQVPQADRAGRARRVRAGTAPRASACRRAGTMPRAGRGLAGR